jgi:hypothetical protein
MIAFTLRQGGFQVATALGGHEGLKMVGVKHLI